MRPLFRLEAAFALPLLFALASPATAAPDENRNFVGQTGLTFKVPDGWILDSEMQDGLEKARLHEKYEDGSPLVELHVKPSDFRDPANFYRWKLVEVDAIPKDSGGKARSLDSFLQERTQELTHEGVAFSTNPWVFGPGPHEWPAGTFSVEIDQPYRLWEFYTQNDKSIIHYAAGATPRGALRGMEEIRNGIQDSVSRYQPRLEDPLQKELESPRPFPRDLGIPICALIAGFLAVKSRSPKTRRVATAALAVLAASCVGEFIACRIPTSIFLSAAIQHALAFAVFGAVLGTRRKNRIAAAIAGGAAGYLQGLLFGWAPRAWESLHYGYGPGYGLLVNIGMTVSDTLPYVLPEINTWTQAIVASFAIYFAFRKERGYPALTSLLMTSAPMLLWLMPSAFFGAFGGFYYIFRSMPTQECALAAACAAVAVFGATAFEARARPSFSGKSGRAPL